MIINLASPHQRSCGTLRRTISRQILALLVMMMMSSCLTLIARGRTRSVQSQISLGDTLDPLSLSSHIATCNIERENLKRSVDEIRDIAKSWSRPQATLKVFANSLPAEVWLKRLSINSTGVEVVGVAQSERDVQRLVSLPELANTGEPPRIVSTRSEGAGGRYIFHLSAGTMLSSDPGLSQEAADEIG